MRVFILTVLSALALVHCQDYSCPKGKSKTKKIVLSPGDSFSYNTNFDDKYYPKTKCPVVYKASKKCKAGIRFSCDSFDLPNKDSARCRKGDRLILGKKAYCGSTAPDAVTLTGKAAKKGLRVLFASDKKNVGAGAQCTAVCLEGAATTTTAAPTTTAECPTCPAVGVSCLEPDNKNVIERINSSTLFNCSQSCRDTPEDGKGCRFWTYFPRIIPTRADSEQNRICFLLNSCAKLVLPPPAEVVSGERSCDPLDFLLALGQTLTNNIVALKEAKTAVEATITPEDVTGAKNCTEFVDFVNKLVDLPPQSREIVTVADKIVASIVACNDEQKVELGQAIFSLDVLIVKTEAVLEELQIALKDATGTTAFFSTTTFTAPPVTGSAQDLDIPQTQNMASGLSWDLLENIFFNVTNNCT